MAVKDKQVIRAWDVPRIVFEELEKLSTAVVIEEEMYPYNDRYPYNPDKLRPEVRTFRELDRKKIKFNGVICLQIFPEYKAKKMQSIFYLWIGETLGRYGETEGFSHFVKHASLCINGWREKGESKEVDVVAVYPMEFNGWVMANMQFHFIWKTMEIAHKACRSPRFLKESIPLNLLSKS